jgi:prepilin signal peptidase PulO-like enzyme (type II secretory pathway)
MQGVGLFCLITALLTFWTIIGPMIFGLTGFWLFVIGGLKSKSVNLRSTLLSY